MLAQTTTGVSHAGQGCPDRVDATRAIERVYQHSGRTLRARASRIVGWDAAEDLVQEAFVIALERHRGFRGHSSIATWITRILVNTGVDELRQRRFVRRLTDVAVIGPDCVIPRDCEHVALRVALRVAFASLRPREREILLLADVLGHTYQEVSVRMSICVGTTKSRLLRARRRLAHAVTAGAAVQVESSRVGRQRRCHRT